VTRALLERDHRLIRGGQGAERRICPAIKSRP